MPVFDGTTLSKIAALQARRAAGYTDEVFQLVKIEWPSPDGSIYYSVIDPNQAATVAPGVSPIDVRIIAENDPEWFLPVSVDSSIGDEELNIEMWDFDEAISTLMVDHGEGVKVFLYYYFPYNSLLLPMWHGHLRFEDEATIDAIKLTASQGIRSGESVIPSRGHYEWCSAVFGGLLLTQGQIDEGDCPFNLHIAGGVGINNPGTGLPWTFCDRKDHASCTARGVDTKYHLSHNGQSLVVQNNQTSGGSLFSTSQNNQTNLTEPVTVIVGTRRKYGMKVMHFRRDENRNNPEHGWFFAQYEGCEGPIKSITQVKVTVGGETKFDPFHYAGYRLGGKAQTPYPSGNYRLTEHSYSGTSHILYNFGYVNPTKVNPEDASASALFEGLDNIRVYTNSTTYTSIFTNNRVWFLARVLCDKRWGYGYDYTDLDIDSFIAAADWVDDQVTFTDPFGTEWTHVRGSCDAELIGRKLQEQIEDICLAGRLSRPFLFNGKIHIVPLKALDSGELAACPVFTDEGDSPNIIWEDDKSTLKIKRKSSFELTNQVKINFDDILNNYQQRPLRPIEDLDAQLAAGRVLGKTTRKVNSKEYNLLGAVHEALATKVGWAILDLGPNDDGGLQNNCMPSFKAWVLDTLNLHVEKVIKIDSSRLTKYGFEYFRIKKIKHQADLTVELELVAYNETYMNAFEETAVITPPMLCSIDADCPAGYQCVNGTCVPIIDPPICEPDFGTVTYTNGVLRVPIDECII
jgi:hypothetical protein